MESQSLQGIAVGRRNDSDCMLMFCPFNQRVYHTNNCRLDESGHTATAFNLQYDGGMFIGLYSSDKCTSSPPELYTPGTDVSFLRPDGVHIRGSMISVPIGDPSNKSPTSSQLSYSICLVDGNIKQVSPFTMAVITRKNIDTSPIQSLQLVLPQWIGNSKKVTLDVDGKCHLGRLLLDQGNWKFKSKTSKSTMNLPNFTLTYKSLTFQQLIFLGWHSNFISAAAATHVSASRLTCDCPDSLIKALAPTFTNRAIWHESYMEELNGLIKLGTFHEISLDKYG
eukprot:13836670-Ditylum_brightwellii.AAC.1